MNNSFLLLAISCLLVMAVSCVQPDSSLSKARAEMEAEDYLGAIVEVNTLLQLGDSSCEAFQIRASSYRRIGKFKKAILDLQLAQTEWPTCYEAPLELARTLADSGDTAMARRTLDSIPPLQNRIGAEIQLEKSKLHYYQDRFDLALNEINRAIACDSTYHLSWYYRGYLHSRFFDENRSATEAIQKLLNFDQAVNDFSRCIVLDPTFEDAWFQRGIVYLNQFKPEKGLPDLERAIHLAPKYSYYYVGRAEYYLREKRFDMAMKDLKTAARLNPDDRLADSLLQVAQRQGP